MSEEIKEMIEDEESLHMKCEAIRRKTPVRYGERQTKVTRSGSSIGKCGMTRDVTICPDCECKMCKSCFNNKKTHGCKSNG